MCGIVAFVGAQRRDLAQHLASALATLEYRGYDSAGLALATAGGLLVAKTVGGLATLAPKIAAFPPAAVGFAHTRWATHGAATEANAHPHVSPDGRMALILNGIVENDAALRKDLAARGIVFQTGNDGETLLRWLEQGLAAEPSEAAVRAALRQVTGNFALAILHTALPDAMIVARRGSPLAIAVGPAGTYVVSDPAAVRAAVDAVHYLQDDEVLIVHAGVRPTLAFAPLSDSIATPTMDGFESFTLKEMHEQPAALAHALAASLAKPLTERGIATATVRALDRVVLVGCGSAFLAASAAKALIERHARLPAEAWLASELRLGDPLLSARTLVVAVSQSGETADTLACLRLARAAGAPTLAVCNADQSTMARLCDAFWPLACGPEIGVASTKAYTAMLLQLTFLSFELGVLRGTVPLALTTELAFAARELPGLVAKTLLQAGKVAAVARAWRDERSFVFIGRHVFHPSACEGALKLRELSYVNAEGYAAGELKHGSIALIGPGHPVIAVAPRGATALKMASSLHEVKARGARVFGLVTEGDDDTAALCDDVVELPATMDALMPILVAIPLQIFAYSLAKELGRPIDRPRNLAKSVTVE